MNKQRRDPPGARVPRTGGQGVITAGARHRAALRDGHKPAMARLTRDEASSFLRGAAKPDATRTKRGSKADFSGVQSGSESIPASHPYTTETMSDGRKRHTPRYHAPVGR